MHQATHVRSDGAQAHQTLVKVMEGLAGILLLFGIRWSEAQQALKAGFYYAAEKNLLRRGKKPSQRRIYIDSGVSPESIRAIRTGGVDQFISENKTSLTYLVHCWRFVEPYGSEGTAKRMMLKSEVGKDFRSLCAEALPGFGYKAVIQDLVEQGVVKIIDDQISLLKINVLASNFDLTNFQAVMRGLRIPISADQHNLTADDHADHFEYEKSLHRWVGSTEHIDDVHELKDKLVSLMAPALKKSQNAIDIAEAQSVRKRGNKQADRLFYVEVCVHVEPPLTRGEGS